VTELTEALLVSVEGLVRIAGVEVTYHDEKFLRAFTKVDKHDRDLLIWRPKDKEFELNLPSRTSPPNCFRVDPDGECSFNGVKMNPNSIYTELKTWADTVWSEEGWAQ
jgi:hypothetical protein